MKIATIFAILVLASVIFACSNGYNNVLVTNNSSQTIGYQIWDDSNTYTLASGASNTHSVWSNFLHEPQNYGVVGGHNSVILTYINKTTYTFSDAPVYSLSIASSFNSSITVTIKEANDRMDVADVSIPGSSTNTSQNVYTAYPQFIVTNTTPGTFTPIIDKPVLSGGTVSVTIH